MDLPEDLEGLVADGRSADRRDDFRAARDAARAWRRSHPYTLDDHLRFLASVQAVLGPFPPRRRRACDRGRQVL